MKAISGRRYAEIATVDGNLIVKWVFTDADLPEWCDASENPVHPFCLNVVDITDQLAVGKKHVYHGNGNFTPPVKKPFEQ